VQLKEFTGVVLVETLGEPGFDPLEHGISARGIPPLPATPAHLGQAPLELGRHRSRRNALGVVEIEKHGRVASGGHEQVLEPPHGVRPDGFLDVMGQEDAVEALGEVDVEVVGPEVDHDLLELPVGRRRSHYHQLPHLATQLPQLTSPARHPPALVTARGGIAPLRQGPLALAPFAL
jgi:hypothetical protein